MIRINQLKLHVRYEEKDLMKAICKQLRVAENDIINYKIVKRSLDARKKPNLHYVLVVDVAVKKEAQLLRKYKKLQEAPALKYNYPSPLAKESPIIVGYGPAGMFAAYILAELGLKPVVFERGGNVDDRTLSVRDFWQTGQLDTESNVQFGEGGAGTFSDGKLTTRSKDPRAKKVMEILVKHGAPEEILYSNKPHVGTDVLKDVVKSMREYTLKLGGQIHFNTRIDDFVIDDCIKGVVTSDGQTYSSSNVIVAIGHSARDTYEKLYDRGLSIEQKPFAMGVRIEHQQEMINLNQYGSLEDVDILGASDYKLTYSASNDRSVYSFCVCPGGMVVASASETGGLVVNGMSEHARDQKNINGALLVQIQTTDFDSDHPLAGVDFQRKYERMAFELGGSDYSAPMQTVGSFLGRSDNQLGSILPSYKPRLVARDLSQCLPDFVTQSLKEALSDFGKKIKGFDSDHAVLTAIESRSSAPIRMIRSFEDMEANIKGVYPVGEGAGYAGGIVSAAIDGVKVAEIIAKK